MRKTSAAAVAIATSLAAAALVPHAARAEGPATIHGLVYSCNDRTPIPQAHVTLRGIDDGTLREITTGADGRFIRVGLMPGRYLIVASSTRFRKGPGDVASRMALLDTDDNLDVRIGTYTRSPGGTHGSPRVAGPTDADPYARAVPLCDPPLVPLASSTSTRYVIR